MDPGISALVVARADLPVADEVVLELVAVLDGKDVMVLHAYETADKYLQKLKVLNMKWDSAGWPVVDPAELDRYQSVQQ